MITTRLLPSGDVLVTFMINDTRPVSVVGNFNDWDPTRHPLVDELDGQRSITVAVPSETPVTFRYLADGGDFYDDPSADRYEPNGYGQTHSVLDASLHVERAPSAAPQDPHDEQVATDVVATGNRQTNGGAKMADAKAK